MHAIVLVASWVATKAITETSRLSTIRARQTTANKLIDRIITDYAIRIFALSVIIIINRNDTMTHT